MKKSLVWLTILSLGICSVGYAVNVPLKIDFNNGSSPTLSGYTGFAVATYSTSRGFGWDKTVSSNATKGSSDMYNDKHYSTNDATFKIDVANGNYTVYIYGYNASYYDSETYDDMQLTAEGILVCGDIDMTNYNRKFDVTVSDGQMNLTFHDNGGKGNRWCISGLQVTSAINRPSIQSHTGTLVDGGTLTLTGTGFGTGPKVNIFDDFEPGGAPGATIPLTSADVGKWNISGGYSNLGRSGNSGFNMKTGRMNVQFANCQEFYFSYCVIIPPGTLFPNASEPESWVPDGEKQSVWKLAWIMDGSGGFNKNDDLCLPTHVSRKFQIGGNAVSPGFYTGNSWWTFKNWNRISIWVKADPSNPTGNTGKLFFQGIAESERHYQQTASNKPVMNNAGDGAKWNYLNIPGWSSGCGTNCMPYYDDFYLASGDNAQARIEIGNKPRYRDCTRLAVCTPTAWSNGSITATVRMGSLRPTDDMYVYVVDKNGVVSPAYSLAGGGQTTVRPMAHRHFGGYKGNTGVRIVDINGRSVSPQNPTGIHFQIIQQGNQRVVKPVLMLR